MNTNLHWLHEKLVIVARANDLKDTAREFGCYRNAVGQWLGCHIVVLPP